VSLPVTRCLQQSLNHFSLFALLLAFSSTGFPAQPQFEAPRPAQRSLALQSEDLAVIVNDDDPNSVAVAEYYRHARGIPEKNLVHVRIPESPPKLTYEQFQKLREKIQEKIDPGAQVILMVWTAPYAVECNSITSAMSLGFDAGQCANTCAPGKLSAYYNSSASRPFSTVGIRPSMLLPTDSVAQAKALIDRGVQSAFRLMPASAYFLVTSDTARNSRASHFPQSQYVMSKKLTIKTLKQENLTHVDDIMVYQTGAVTVLGLDTLHFRAGALADHLTSAGGDLHGKSQMSSLRWLKAGATASYGTVSEPCNYWQKFPNSTVLLEHYLRGDTAIEAYWKSVAWPTQGVFIGEPLAAPYRR
jgi:uncharacterized protein (TIGR03790 family)